MMETPIAPRRRNGRPQACEPCRKRKTACDHALPICSRCINRRTDKECVYLAAPMTRRSISTGQVATAPALPLSPGTTTPSSTIGSPVNRTGSGVLNQRLARPNQLFSEPPGFLGSTSFAGTFQDSSEGLEQFSKPEEVQPVVRKISTSNGAQDAQSGLLSNDLMQLGLQLLDQVPDEKTCTMLRGRNVFPDDGTSGVVQGHLIRGLWDFVGDRRRTSEAYRKGIVEQITENTRNVLHDVDDPMEWVDSLRGRNLRWDVLGVLFTYWGIGVACCDPDDPVFEIQPGTRNDSRQLMIYFKECGASCITLCNALGCSNQIFVLLLYRHLILESMIGGDATLTVWRSHGDLCTVAVHGGMHNDVGNKITLCTEFRRRIYAKIFNIDKVLSSFVGRPPLLSRRYSSTPLPLDIDDDAFFSGDAALQNALARLDENGWQKDGSYHSNTTTRARAMFSIVRDEIMELSLGSVVSNLVNRAFELKEQSRQIYEQLPTSILYQSKDVHDSSVPGPMLFARLLIRLGYLQNVFLVERLVIKHGSVNGQDLIDIAREMLGSTLLIFKHQDRFIGFHRDFEWLLMSFAVPASGTLCEELLKQAKHPSESVLILPKSEVVQNLSLLVAFCEWVKPFAPNAELCHRVKEIVSKVLDQVLNAGNPPSNDSSDGAPMTWDLDVSADFPLFEDFGNFDLMGTFDWLA